MFVFFAFPNGSEKCEKKAMSKSRKTWNKRKRALWVLIGVTVGVLLFWRLVNNPKGSDLQTLLQNLPKEISQSINNAYSNQQNDEDIIRRFEELSELLKSKQEDQAKQLERQRRVLEKKIKELKKLPSDATLREKLVYSFEYDSSRKFPAFIWQTYDKPVINTRTVQDDLADSASDKSDNDGQGMISEELASNKANWDEKNPGFVHEIFNEDIIYAMVRHYYASVPEVVEAYNALPTKILKIDFFKYLILLARGGLYADMDTVPLQPIPNWVPGDVEPRKIGLIIGIEHDAQDNSWKNDYVRRLQFGTWIIQAKPGHPVVREIVAQITETTLRRKRDNELNLNFRNDLNIMSWTGSGVWTDVIFTYFNDYLRSGIARKVTWKEFHNLKTPKVLSDVLIFPEFTFNAPNTITNDDPYKMLYFTTHDNAKFWKTVPKVGDVKDI